MFNLVSNLYEKSYKDLGMVREESFMKTAVVNAVYGEEMEEFLESLGVLTEIKQGKKTCYFCIKPVKMNDIVSIFPADNDVQVCCSSLHCYQLLLREDL